MRIILTVLTLIGLFYQTFATTLKIGDVNAKLNITYIEDGIWRNVSLTQNQHSFNFKNESIYLDVSFLKSDIGYDYTLSVNALFPTRVRVQLSVPAWNNAFHVIPGNIFGDNNCSVAGYEDYPHLTDKNNASKYCNSFWELRADRAAMPVSILCNGSRSIGISINPYSDEVVSAVNEKGEPQKYVRNGVFAALPNSIGVSLGYGNDPFTFLEKINLQPPTSHLMKKGQVNGSIVFAKGDGRLSAHQIIEKLYAKYRDVPTYKHTYSEAIDALMKGFRDVSWGKPRGWETGEFYRNLNYSWKGNAPEGRAVVEIGWTGGGPLAYALALGQMVNKWTDKDFNGRLMPGAWFDKIAANYNPTLGFYDEMLAKSGIAKPYWNNKPLNPQSKNNGWWSGYVVANQFTAYNNGSACYYLLKAASVYKEHNIQFSQLWIDNTLKVLDNVIELQLANGSYGYAYSETERKMDIKQGFAGAWFAAANALAYKLTQNDKYLKSASKAIDYYHNQFVRKLNGYGTPMDTYMAVDGEGNLAFVRAARLLHEETGNILFLQMLKDGADYECLWRYGFKARPEFKPLSETTWNSCGGSLTSVSNPHLHPMSLLINEDLIYLSKKTGNSYYSNRAEDGLAWILQTMELYPLTTGMGQYGMLTERYCPSDGLVVDKNADGTPSSIWYAYNAWANAAALEAISEKVLNTKILK